MFDDKAWCGIKVDKGRLLSLLTLSVVARLEIAIITVGFRIGFKKVMIYI